jgi:hypothetical protein
VSDVQKSEAVEQIADILADSKAPPRSKIAAARALATMEGATLQSIDVALRAYQQGELADAIADLQTWRESVEGGQPPHRRRRPLLPDRNHVVARTLGETIR